MISNEMTLLDRLNEIVDEIHIEEVKKIVITLSKINQLKHKLEKNLIDEKFYNKVEESLKDEFNIKRLKIVYVTSDKESILYSSEDLNSKYKHLYEYNVSKLEEIKIYFDMYELTEYNILSLNTYLKEIVHLFYLQHILLNVKQTSTIDPLTQLHNRTSFNQEMKTLVPLAIREKMKFGVLIVNVDRFRAVNDEHGDEFGDEFLKLYAKVIKENIRTSDIAVRFSGAEFLVLFINVESESMTLKLADKIRKKLTAVYMITKNNDKFKKTVCIGVSMFPEDSRDIHQVIKFAEMALSDAQSKGRNNIERYKNDFFNKIDFF